MKYEMNLNVGEVIQPSTPKCSLQIGKAEFVKVNFVRLGLIKPRTLYPGSHATNTLLAKIT